MPHFYFSRWMKNISSQPSKWKVKKKIPVETGYFLLLLSPHFPIFPSNFLFSPYSSSIAEPSTCSLHFFPTFSLFSSLFHTHLPLISTFVCFLVDQCILVLLRAPVFFTILHRLLFLGVFVFWWMFLCVVGCFWVRYSSCFGC